MYLNYKGCSCSGVFEYWPRFGTSFLLPSKDHDHQQSYAEGAEGRDTKSQGIMKPGHGFCYSACVVPFGQGDLPNCTVPDLSVVQRLLLLA